MSAPGGFISLIITNLPFIITQNILYHIAISGKFSASLLLYKVTSVAYPPIQDLENSNDENLDSSLSNRTRVPLSLSFVEATPENAQRLLNALEEWIRTRAPED